MYVTEKRDTKRMRNRGRLNVCDAKREERKKNAAKINAATVPP
jgi:hypothetical protein